MSQGDLNLYYSLLRHDKTMAQLKAWPKKIVAPMRSMTYYIYPIIRKVQLITCSGLIQFTFIHAAVLLKIHLIYFAILIYTLLLTLCSSTNKYPLYAFHFILKSNIHVAILHNQIIYLYIILLQQIPVRIARNAYENT